MAAPLSVLAGLTALFLAASLVIEAAFPAEIPLGRWLALAGLVFLVTAILMPYRPRPPEVPVNLYTHVPHPHLAHRKDAGPVKVRDQLPVKHPNPFIRFNAKVALICTAVVGSMWCAYAFGLLALAGLPTALKPGNIGFLFWFSSDLLQLTLLSVIIVGQNLQAVASDKRAEQTYLDAEAGLHEQAQAAAHLAAQDEQILAILEQIAANTALTEEVKAAVRAATAPATVMTPKPGRGAQA